MWADSFRLDVRRPDERGPFVDLALDEFLEIFHGARQGADSCSAANVPLFDDLVSERKQLRGHVDAERLRSLEVDH
jgi:hypothetical protein